MAGEGRVERRLTERYAPLIAARVVSPFKEGNEKNSPVGWKPRRNGRLVASGKDGVRIGKECR